MKTVLFKCKQPNRVTGLSVLLVMIWCCTVALNILEIQYPKHLRTVNVRMLSLVTPHLGFTKQTWE